jgi:thiamine-monophosphate kinase
MPKLSELGEIEAVRRLIAARGGDPGVVIGPGDDAAVLSPSPGTELVVTTDAFVEGRHYLPEWSPPLAAGARLAAANLSDLAAMAARPRWALLSMGVRAEREVEALLELQRGVNAALAAHGAQVVGGNLTAVEGVEWYSLTLLGEVDGARVWTRAGASAGDRLAVTGRPGRARAGLELARRLGAAARAAEWQPLVDAWLAPAERVTLARALAKVGAVTAAIDVSDGLAGDLARLCEASGVGVELDAAAFPEDPELARAAAALGVREEELRLGPSDDYELILGVDPSGAHAVAEEARARGVPLTFAGHFTERIGTLAIREASGATRPLLERGYDPFVGPAG